MIGPQWLYLAFGQHRTPGRVVGISKPRDGRVFSLWLTRSRQTRIVRQTPSILLGVARTSVHASYRLENVTFTKPSILGSPQINSAWTQPPPISLPPRHTVQSQLQSETRDKLSSLIFTIKKQFLCTYKTDTQSNNTITSKCSPFNVCMCNITHLVLYIPYCIYNLYNPHCLTIYSANSQGGHSMRTGSVVHGRTMNAMDRKGI